MEKYAYICTVRLRPRGALGVCSEVDFPICMDKPRVLVRELWDKWYEMLGDEFQPDVIVKVNGQPTVGEIDRLWEGERVEALA